jgi:hypothetical protein
LSESPATVVWPGVVVVVTSCVIATETGAVTIANVTGAVDVVAVAVTGAVTGTVTGAATSAGVVGVATGW